jgi:uncharacterized membrane protein
VRSLSEPPADGTPTKVAVAGHPLHPMLVTFPIAFLLGAFAADLAFWYTADPFWARMAVWLIGAGAVMGTLAAVTGTVELLAVPGIRRRGAAWSHFIAAVMLLSVAFANLFFRIGDPVEAVLPWGLYLSALGALLVALAGWLGGTLVFEHQIGVVEDDGD